MKSPTKMKSIDLGALQDQLQLTKRTQESESKQFYAAQERFDRAKKAHQEAHEALASASRTILSP